MPCWWAPARCAPSATAGSSASPSDASAGLSAACSPEPIACMVTRSGDVPIDIPLFAEPEARVVIFTPAEIDTSGMRGQRRGRPARHRRADADDRAPPASRRLRRPLAAVRGGPDAVRRAAARGARGRAVPDAGAEARRRRHRSRRSPPDPSWPTPGSCRSDGCSNVTDRCISATRRRSVRSHGSDPVSSFDFGHLGDGTMMSMGSVTAAPTALSATDAVEALAEARERTLALVASVSDRRPRARPFDPDEPAGLGSGAHRRVRGPVARPPLRRPAAAAATTSPTSTTHSKRLAPAAAICRSWGPLPRASTWRRSARGRSR